MNTLFEAQAPRPLADRLRPQSLGEILGQDHLLGSEGPIGRMVGARRLASMILWGPPGWGKTTIARLLAQGTDLAFEPLSAVFSGVADLRKVFEAARKRRELGQGTLLFVDEIHRFNRAQQDAFLPYVERHGDPGWRDDREPVFRANWCAAVAGAGLRAAPARRRRAGDAAGAGRNASAKHAAADRRRPCAQRGRPPWVSGRSFPRCVSARASSTSSAASSSRRSTKTCARDSSAPIARKTGSRWWRQPGSPCRPRHRAETRPAAPG